MLKKLAAFVAVVMLVVVAALALGVRQWLHQPLALPEGGVVYEVSAGASVARVAYDLERKSLLSQPRLLSLYARLTGLTEIKRGEYRVAPGTSPLQLLQLLVAGNVIDYSLTLVEGWTYQQALAYLHQQPKLVQKLEGGDWQQHKKLLGIDKAHPEGWFFPDTYRYIAGSSDIDILRRAHRAMVQALDAEWQNRAENLPYKDAYQALVMASIVERETGAPSEREQIAGVFVRRLNKGMRLQTDPTVIYGMGDRYQGNIRKSDLRRATPYNTYVIRGLPPTPIALPGREAIYAALHPDSGSSLYFVARGDGSHQFSPNLEAHNKAVREYQFKRRADYRSSPAP